MVRVSKIKSTQGRSPWVLLIFAILLILLLVEAGFSLGWPIAHDEAPLFYEAFLMRVDGRLPYRDLIDFQMPGAFAAFYGFGLLTGFDPLRIRILDLTLLAALLTVTFFILMGFGWKPALAAMTLFGLKYLEGGPSLALQREYLILVLLAPAIWLNMQTGQPLARRIAIGLCFGLAASIKPQAAIGLLPILFFDIAEGIRSYEISPFKAALSLAVGCALPVTVLLVWLGLKGALGPFLIIAYNYWPLYAQINGQLVVTAGADRWLLILDQIWRLGGNGIWLLPACLGVYVSLFKADLAEDARRQVRLLVWLAVAYAIYPAMTGQFFPYHYLPFVYFVTLLSSFCLLELREMKWRTGALALLLLAILVGVRPPAAVLRQIEGRPIAAAGRHADQITAYLDSHLKPGDTVQPLDWTGGALQAMLSTRARLATTFVFDFYFYHHVSHPYIQGLRLRFLDELAAASPAYIVEITAMDKPWVAGPDTGREFPELRLFLGDHYRADVQGDDYIIYVRRK